MFVVETIPISHLDNWEGGEKKNRKHGKRSENPTKEAHQF